MNKFAIPLVSILLALTISWNFSNIRPFPIVDANSLQVYFTIVADGKRYDVTDETLRVGWWFDESQKSHRDGKNFWEQGNYNDVWRLVSRIQHEIDTKPYDGAINFHACSEPRFTVDGATNGKKLDVKKLRSDILETLKSKQYRQIQARILTVEPRTQEQVLQKIALRSEYKTRFANIPNRVHNITLAMEKFNGLVISNGQTASFNKIVGKRTAEAGFKEAKIIVDGEFVPGIGGGVCQASTTIFNALLLSGLKIETSHNHSLPISYVPIGRDAMVSSCADLVFTNNTGGNLYFETGTTRNTAWIKIYGNKTSVQYKPRTTVTEMPLKDDECDPARKSTTYLDAYRDGRLVHTKLIRKSSYRSTKGTPPEPEPEIQNP